MHETRHQNRGPVGRGMLIVTVAAFVAVNFLVPLETAQAQPATVPPGQQATPNQTGCNGGLALVCAVQMEASGPWQIRIPRGWNDRGTVCPAIRGAHRIEPRCFTAEAVCDARPNYRWIESSERCIPRENCSNNRDDDGDGRIDCDDPECSGRPICRQQADEEPDAEICDNGRDDDGDGMVDCNDEDCEDLQICQDEPPLAPAGPTGESRARRNWRSWGYKLFLGLLATAIAVAVTGVVLDYCLDDGRPCSNSVTVTNRVTSGLVQEGGWLPRLDEPLLLRMGEGFAH